MMTGSGRVGAERVGADRGRVGVGGVGGRYRSQETSPAKEYLLTLTTVTAKRLTGPPSLSSGEKRALLSVNNG